MAAPYSSTLETRRGVPSPRPRANNNKNVLCRNVHIYGHCRYENAGCTYEHDPARLARPQSQKENMKQQRLNVDSPTFTPLQPATNGVTSNARGAAISPKAASAKIFTPKSQKSAISPPNLQSKKASSDWNPQSFQEFIPQNYEPEQFVDQPSTAAVSFDPFTTSDAMSNISLSAQQGQINPYAQDASALTTAAFYQNQSSFTHPLNQHHYSDLAPYRENMLAYQRLAHDFFIPDRLREDLQSKSNASLQIFLHSNLPNVDPFHTLVTLDTNSPKNASLFGYPSWIYKATSGKDGHLYALRRLEGFRLTSEAAINAKQPWKGFINAGVVTVHDVFTTQAFSDRSLIFVTDYHPDSETLASKHFGLQSYQRPFGGRQVANQLVQEQILWGYIVQLSSAIKAIHSNNLAARILNPSKILVTSKNRVRLNACAIFDIIQHDIPHSLSDLQQEDLAQLGRLILCIATNNLNAGANINQSIEKMSRSYSEQLKDAIRWLVTPMPPEHSPGGSLYHKSIDVFLMSITTEVTTVLDNSLHAEDTLFSTLARELENGRLVRLMTKLAMINERPASLDPSQPVNLTQQPNDANSWSETGERYFLKLFRDYVFHRVDARGRPVLDLAHVIACLNRLDAGTDEKIVLTSRNDEDCFLVTFREVKKGLESAWAELESGRGGPGRGR